MKIVVERSGAAALAAIMKDKRFVGKKVCVILTGGNIDFSTYFDNLRSNIKQ
jgi:threonine dehydratase